MSQFRSSNKTVYSAKYQMVWYPKCRGEWLEAIVREMVTEHGGEVLGLEMMPEHVHRLVEVPPAMPLSRLVQLLKGRSSQRLRQKFPRLRLCRRCGRRRSPLWAARRWTS